MTSERAAERQSLVPETSTIRSSRARPSARFDSSRPGARFDGAGEAAVAQPRRWERIPVWLLLAVLAGVALWSSRVLSRAIEHSVADELRLILAAEIEVAEVLSEDPDHALQGARPGTTSGARDEALSRARAEQFSRALGSLPVLSRVGRSGETYAFDRNGVMLTPSRFDDELREQDLLTQRDGKAIVELRDPGGHVAAGYRPSRARAQQPLTKAVAQAIAGRDGIDLDGYRDYRGARVVGAWRWLPQYQLGVVVELDADEAFALNDGLRSALLAVYLAMALALFSVGGSSGLYARAKTQIAEAKQLGQYTLVRELGRGGMGTVYEARHALLRRPTAVKLMARASADPVAEAEALLRFEREVQLTSELSHPNTVTIYDYGRTAEGVFYYAMEFIDGVDLDRLVQLDGPVGAGRTIHFALQICGSLTEAHNKSLIHRDIKPANILVCERGGLPDRIKVLDFGLVKSLLGPQVSAAHVLVGTPQFMAPEVLSEPALADVRSDIYALGAVLYWLTTGHTIFERGGSMKALSAEATVMAPSSLRADIPPDLERVIMRCLAREPRRRPASMAELSIELSHCQAAGSWSAQDAQRYWYERGSLLMRDRPAPAGVPTLAAS